MKINKRIAVTVAVCVAVFLPSYAIEQKNTAVQEDGFYYSRDQVALYIVTYGKLPLNFITKSQAQALGWTGGSLEPYAPGKSIGGDDFRNYEKRLPPGSYRECDIDTYKSQRGGKRIVFTPQRQIYYTEDHYQSFFKLQSIAESGGSGVSARWVSLATVPQPEAPLRDAAQYDGTGTSVVQGMAYNGYATGDDGLIVGTFTLAVKKPAKGKTTAAATLTFTALANGKKTKINGNVDLAAGEGSGALAGLTLGANTVGGTVAKAGILNGGVDAAKAKDAAALSVLSKFSGKSYVVAFGPGDSSAYEQGGYSTLTIALAAKGRAKVSGVLADGTKVTASVQMTVGDDYCFVPVVYSKKSRLGFVAWFNKDTRELVDVRALAPWRNTVKPAFTMDWEVVGIGAKGSLPAGNRMVSLDDSKLLSLVPGAIEQTPFDIPWKVNGSKWDAGKAAKVAYKGGVAAIAGANVSGLKLTYTARTGLFKGSFTVYAVKGGKLVKNKFSVFGAVTGGTGYGTAVLRGKGGAAVTAK